MINTLTQLIKDNPVFAGIVSLYGVGVATYLLRDIPQKIIGFLKKHLTTTLILSNMNIGYYKFMGELEKNKVSNKIRVIKFYNGRWGSDSTITKGIGVGRHFIMFNNVPMILTLSESETKSQEEKLSLSLTKFGRSHKVFDDLKKQLEKIEDDKYTDTRIWIWNDGWQFVSRMPLRGFDTIFIDKEAKETLLNSLRAFVSSEDWYVVRGVPYQYGLLLHGEPGSGKTSLIKAIASYLEYNIAILSASNMYSLGNAISQLPDKTILVIEDVDSSPSTQQRTTINCESKKDTEVLKSKGDTFKEEKSYIFNENKFAGMGLSDILNSLDGLLHKHGRILILTTNHVEKLDEALIRPGRINLKLYVGYVTIDVFKEFLKSFFVEESNTIKNLNIIKLKQKVTVSYLQQQYLDGKTFQWFIDNCVEV